MFNRHRNADIAAQKALIQQAVEQSRVPGQTQSRGNAMGTTNNASSPVQFYKSDEAAQSGRSGVGADGLTFFPFLLGVDELGDPDARLI